MQAPWTQKVPAERVLGVTVLAGTTAAGLRDSRPSREIADPTRLATLSLLIGEGPQTMSEMAEMLEMAGPRLSNHLARLRSAGLVQVKHSGRQPIYRIAGPHIGEALASLQAVVAENDAGGQQRMPAALSPLSQARSCYGHLAGRLGVGLLDHFVRQEALLPAAGIRADVSLGPRPEGVMSEFGVQLGGPARGASPVRLRVAGLDRAPPARWRRARQRDPGVAARARAGRQAGRYSGAWGHGPRRGAAHQTGGPVMRVRSNTAARQAPA